MRSRHALAFSLAVLGASIPAALRADVLPSPVVPACANPALPAAILAGVVPAGEPAAAPLPTVAVTGGVFPLTLAVAADEKTRELGLMCVTHLQAHAGMIFVFPEARTEEFWMKNTLVPLDMIWVDANGRVTTVAMHVPASTRATPDDRVARRDGYGKYVIELRDGEATPDGLRPGVKLSLPKLAVSP